MEKIKSHTVFGGEISVHSHSSRVTSTQMKFGVFTPKGEGPFPVLYWLSGLTCTEENFMTKAGAFRKASELGLILVMPDTSPRGANIVGEDERWDFGTGAGFYLDSENAPWDKNYRMYSYVANELPDLIHENFPTIRDRESISGHSMGGHGALVLALSKAREYRSVSAFSPICHPTTTPWGQHAFERYLGSDRQRWERYDATLLMRKGPKQIPLLIDQGDQDEFLKDELVPQMLIDAAKEVGFPIIYRSQRGYDHSYFFISTFIEDHLAFHSLYLHQ